MIQAAAVDAFANAELNGISNVSFNWGDCDAYIAEMIHRAKDSKILAILDPPREGLRE